MAFWGYILVVGLTLVGSYLLLTRVMGQEAASRNLRYALPWIVVGFAIAVIPFLVTLGGQIVWSVLYLGYVVSIGVWLLHWPRRKRKAGALLLNAGRTWHNKFLFWIGIAEVGVATMITWISWVSLTEFADTSNGVVHTSLAVAFWWTLALLIVFLGLNKLELRENGLCFLYNVVPWKRMKSYTWEVTHPSTLTIRVRPRLIFLPDTMSIKVPEMYRDDIDRVIQTYIPFSPPDSLALS
ncbi:MAG: hypothetical protein ACFB14_28075 [Leptolyngbyaceae cyanobacterium]